MEEEAPMMAEGEMMEEAADAIMDEESAPKMEEAV